MAESYQGMVLVIGKEAGTSGEGAGKRWKVKVAKSEK